MYYRSDRPSLKIDDIYMAICNIKDNNFSIIWHLEKIDHILIAMLKEKFTVCIDMNNSLYSTRYNDTRKHIGIIKSTSEAENFIY